MRRNETEPNYGPRRLPILHLDGREYFVDLRLHELRAVDDPLTRIDLHSAEVAATVESWKAIYCPICSQPAVVRRHDPAEIIRCRRCGQSVVVQGGERL